jgi:hypothetical protein
MAAETTAKTADTNGEPHLHVATPSHDAKKEGGATTNSSEGGDDLGVVTSNDDDEGAATLEGEINERALLRKIDWRLLPAVGILYLLSFLDRSNVGNARIEGLATDLHMTGNQYLTGLTLYFVGYVIFEVRFSSLSFFSFFSVFTLEMLFSFFLFHLYFCVLFCFLAVSLV